MPLVKFLKKFRFFSFDFRQNFEDFAVTKHMRNQIFFGEISKIIFFKKFT
jgi:hypothetical protein